MGVGSWRLDNNYQLDFLTPGISPRLASSLKQIRHKSNARRYPRARPQRQHRFTRREENFGFFLDFAIWFSVAIELINPFVAAAPYFLEAIAPLYHFSRRSLS